MDQDKSELFVVRLPLTDEENEKIEEFFDKEAIATDHEAFSRMAQIVGVPAGTGEMEVVGWCHPLHIQELIASADNEKFACTSKGRIGSRDVALVRQSDAEAQIAARDAKIAELRALRGTIDYLRTENARLKATVGRMRSAGVARTVTGSTGEQPGRSRAVGENDE